MLTILFPFWLDSHHCPSFHILFLWCYSHERTNCSQLQKTLNSPKCRFIWWSQLVVMAMGARNATQIIPFDNYVCWLMPFSLSLSHSVVLMYLYYCNYLMVYTKMWHTHVYMCGLFNKLSATQGQMFKGWSRGCMMTIYGCVWVCVCILLFWLSFVLLTRKAKYILSGCFFFISITTANR